MDILQRIEAKLDLTVKMSNLTYASLTAQNTAMMTKGAARDTALEEVADCMRLMTEELAKYQAL